MPKIAEFYAFMREREQVRLNKEAGLPKPWTQDPVLQQYKFTNVKREHDRTTKGFWRYLRSASDCDALGAEILFNCALMRYFGTVEFFEAVGWQNEFGDVEQEFVMKTAYERLKNKQRVFTGAYVITNQGIKDAKQNVVVKEFLAPFWEACPELVCLGWKTKSWEQVVTAMRKLQGFGGTGFMAKEVMQDYMPHSGHEWRDKNTWCPIGPGARRGLNRIFGRDKNTKVPEKQLLAEMVEIFSAREKYWPSTAVELELHDIQFQCCEFDKYERVLAGEGRPRSRYNGF